LISSAGWPLRKTNERRTTAGGQ
jgi:hypothetical protein